MSSILQKIEEIKKILDNNYEQKVTALISEHAKQSEQNKQDLMAKLQDLSGSLLESVVGEKIKVGVRSNLNSLKDTRETIRIKKRQEAQKRREELSTAFKKDLIHCVSQLPKVISLETIRGRFDEESRKIEEICEKEIVDSIDKVFQKESERSISWELLMNDEKSKNLSTLMQNLNNSLIDCRDAERQITENIRQITLKERQASSGYIKRQIEQQLDSYFKSVLEIRKNQKEREKIEKQNKTFELRDIASDAEIKATIVFETFISRRNELQITMNKSDKEFGDKIAKWFDEKKRKEDDAEKSLDEQNWKEVKQIVDNKMKKEIEHLALMEQKRMKMIDEMIEARKKRRDEQIDKFEQSVFTMLDSIMPTITQGLAVNDMKKQIAAKFKIPSKQNKEKAKQSGAKAPGEAKHAETKSSDESSSPSQKPEQKSKKHRKTPKK